jgi:two-component sensor histidine kinase/ligand-binding sensor domain-containing protein
MRYFFTLRCSLACMALSGSFPGILYAQNYNFSHYSLEEGLSQSEVNCIFEDSRGYLWLGTAGGGLNRFDGKSFVSYGEEDGLCGTIVTAVAEDTKGDLWIGTTWGGICHYNGNAFQRMSVSEGLLSTNVSALAFDSKDRLFIGTVEGLSIYDGSASKKFRHFVKDPRTFVPIHVKCLSRDAQDNIWVGTENGLYIWKQDKDTLISLTDQYKQLNGSIISVYAGQNSIWVAESPNIIFELTPSKTGGPSLYTITELTLATAPVRTAISGICSDKRGRVWITTLGEGIIRIENGKETRFTRNNGLSNNIIATLFEDRSGTMWFGSKGDGAMKYRDDRFIYYEDIEGLKEGDIFAINKDEKGNLWVGTSTNGAWIYNERDGTVRNLNANRDIAESRTSCFYFPGNGETWLGTSKGVIVYHNGNFRKMKLSDTNDIVPVRAIYEDRNKNVWIGTNGYGAIKLTDDKPEFFTGKNGLTDNVYSFAEDGQGRLFIGTGAGVFIYNPGSEPRFTSIMEGLCNSYGGSLVTGPNGQIWAGTDKCIARFDGSKFRSYTVNDGLASNTVYLLNRDNSGNIWVGTNKGIDKVSISADGSITGIRNYNKPEGFRGIECNSRATHKDKEGVIYFGTVKGLVRFDPREDRIDTVAPKVHITNVRVFFEELDWEKFGDSLTPWFSLPDGHEFSYGQNHLTFDFTGISKSIPEGVRYRFMLEGFDEGWNKPSEQSSVTYSNLPPGIYTFKVVACNNDGVWSTVPASYTFSILAPFWRTTGFYLLCAALLGAGIYYYNQLRKVAIRKRNMVLERLVKERTSELQKQKEEREVLLKEIHHRVKNNLQIVNSLINIQSANIKDPEALAVFEESKNKIKSIALIHERLYRGQDLSSIELGDYLNELLKSLIDTYSSKEIKLVADLKVQKLNVNTIIPLGLLLNEIISNSIKYAFNGKDNCEIYIQLKGVDEDTFEMTIGDNGKGFTSDPFDGNNATLGLELVKILVDQLDGTIKKMDHPGTWYFIRFKKAKS